MLTIRETDYYSTDWHDMSSVCTQLQHNGSYSINEEDVEHVIAQALTWEGTTYEKVLEHVHKALQDKEFKAIHVQHKEFISGTEYLFTEYIMPLVDDEGNIVGCFVDASDNPIGATSLIMISIKEIANSNVCYPVIEEIVNPCKGCDLIERIYRAPFQSPEDAELYCKEQNRHYIKENINSGFRVFVADSADFLETSWYQNNMKIVKWCQMLDLDIRRYHYCYIQEVIEDLKKRIEIKKEEVSGHRVLTEDGESME